MKFTAAITLFFAASASAYNAQQPADRRAFLAKAGAAAFVVATPAAFAEAPLTSKVQSDVKTVADNVPTSFGDAAVKAAGDAFNTITGNPGDNLPDVGKAIQNNIPGDAKNAAKNAISDAKNNLPGDAKNAAKNAISDAKNNLPGDAKNAAKNAMSDAKNNMPGDAKNAAKGAFNDAKNAVSSNPLENFGNAVSNAVDGSNNFPNKNDMSPGNAKGPFYNNASISPGTANKSS